MHRAGPFGRIARWVSEHTGHPFAFFVAVGVIVAWAITGPLFGFSDTWQLVINTATTIVTFLMVFVIQNAQTRDQEAMQIKLDELIRSHRGAHNALLDLEELSTEELDRMRAEYEDMARKARRALEGKHGGAHARRQVKRSVSEGPRSSRRSRPRARRAVSESPRRR